MKETIELLKRMKEAIGWHLFWPIRYSLHLYLKKKNIVILYRVWGKGLGDFFAMAQILAAINKNSNSKAIIFTKKPEFFYNNPNVCWLLDYNRMPKLLRSSIKDFLKYMRGDNVFCIGGEAWALKTNPFGTFKWNETNGVRYLESFLPDIRGLIKNLGDAYPVVFFSQDEVDIFNKKFDFLLKDFCLVKSSVGLNRSGGMALKDWNVNNFQEVISLVRQKDPNTLWVQVGESGEVVIDGAIDMLGKSNLRELMYIVSKAKFVFSIEGLVSHLAGAMHVRNMVVFSGWHDYRLLLYPSTIPIVASDIACAPCFNDACNVNNKPCTSEIKPDYVAKQLLSYIV